MNVDDVEKETVSELLISTRATDCFAKTKEVLPSSEQSNSSSLYPLVPLFGNLPRKHNNTDRMRLLDSRLDRTKFECRRPLSSKGIVVREPRRRP